MSTIVLLGSGLPGQYHTYLGESPSPASLLGIALGNALNIRPNVVVRGNGSSALYTQDNVTKGGGIETTFWMEIQDEVIETALHRILGAPAPEYSFEQDPAYSMIEREIKRCLSPKIPYDCLIVARYRILRPTVRYVCSKISDAPKPDDFGPCTAFYFEVAPGEHGAFLFSNGQLFTGTHISVNTQEDEEKGCSKIETIVKLEG